MATNSIYSDLALSFIPNPITGDIRPVTNEAAIKNSLLNLFRTKPGERRFFPEFGVNMEKYLFLPADPFLESDINDELASAIVKFEPRISLVSVETNMEEYGIDIKIAYYVQNFPQLQILETTISRTN